MSFKDLKRKELVRAADEDFALELTEEEQASKPLILAAFEEAGLKFKDYLMANPHLIEQYEEKTEAEERNVLTSADVTQVGTRDELIVGETPQQIITNTGISAKAGEKYLIKMERENPVYQIGRYTWTESHPYAVVDAVDLPLILGVEEGFRQAYPHELEEFYN